jgi:mRNA-degrading endonuclease RelE of RelBE toxin-antitoxin system
MHRDRFDVRTTRPADKDLRRFKGQQRKDVEDILRSLSEAPDRGAPLDGSLSGVRSLHFSLKSSGEYRAAYLMLDSERLCLVFMIAPRENFYRAAERRYQTLLRLGAI